MQAHDLLASRCGGRRRRKGFSDDSAAWLDGLAQRLDIANQLRAARSPDRLDPQAVVETALGAARLGRNAAGHRARREPAAGAGAAADGARIPEEVTMPRPPCSDAPRAAARLRRAVRLGLSAEARARRRPRPAPAVDRAARRARRARGGRAGRRSGLGAAARRQGADARRQDAGAAARFVLRAQSGDAEPAPALQGRRRRRSCTRPRRPIASARISTARTCWKAGCRKPGARRHRLAQPRARGARSRASARRARRAAPSRSGRSRRWWCADRRRCCHGCRRGCRRSSDDTMMRLLDLYRHTDPALARVLEERIGLAAIARAGGMARAERRPAGRRPALAQVRAYFAEAAGTAAKFLARAGRPAHRRARLRRLGHPRQRGRDQRPARRRCSARSTARSRRSRRTWARPGARPSSPSSPSSAAPRASTAPTAPTTAPRTVALLAGGALKGGRVDRRLAGPQGRQSARGPRSQADHRSARRAQGPAQGPPARRRWPRSPAKVFPDSGRREADGGVVGVSCRKTSIVSASLQMDWPVSLSIRRSRSRLAASR